MGRGLYCHQLWHLSCAQDTAGHCTAEAQGCALVLQVSGWRIMYGLAAIPTTALALGMVRDPSLSYEQQAGARDDPAHV